MLPVPVAKGISIVGYFLSTEFHVFMTFDIVGFMKSEKVNTYETTRSTESV